MVERARRGRLGLIFRHGTWLVLGATIILVMAVRVRLLSMPLERDEGEYAYAGQLILHGIPPYREAYNMKLPGTYAAYALIEGVFGQTPSAIHFGVALVNAASIVLMFLLGRTLLDETAGLVAAVFFALLSLSPTMLGLAGHATHFVVLPALAGFYLLARMTSGGISEEGQNRRNWPVAIAGGFCLGLAFIMKQHGIFFGLFGLVYLLWCAASEYRQARTPGGGPRVRERRDITTRSARTIAVFAVGLAAPYVLTCLVLWVAGVFPQFWFWTVSYAGKYASARSLAEGTDLLRRSVPAVIGPNLLWWLLPWAGALVMWWDEKLQTGSDTRKRRSYGAQAYARVFITVLLLCSLAAVSVGFYFRPHYFILLLPVMALLSGEAVSRGLRVLRHEKTLELFVALPVLALFIFGGMAVLIGNGSIFFSDNPSKGLQEVYHSDLFIQAAEAAAYIKAHSLKDARLVVLGSEPEIYFEAARRSATGYIYMYSLMELQPYAAGMQDEMVSEVERARPEYAVCVDDELSWLRRPESLHRLDDWWNSYWPANYDLVTTFDIQQTGGGSPEIFAAADIVPPASDKVRYIGLKLFKRKN